MFDNLTQKLTGIFARLRRKGRLTESDVDECLREVRIALLEADVNLAVAKGFIANVREKLIGQEIWESLQPDEMILKAVYDELVGMLGSDPPRLSSSPSPPSVVLLLGLQGSGKTTTGAKLGLRLRKDGKKPLLAACDLQRPAAIDQVEVLAQQVGIHSYVDRTARDPVAVARAAVAQAKGLFLDVVIVDTAGRLQIDEEMMSQARSIKESVAPSEVLLVADSTTGQEAVNAARLFDEGLGLTGLIFTKLDGDARGGAVLSVRAVTGRPVKFVGTGEAADALEPFMPERIARRILGYGDIMGLVEKAQEAIDQTQARALEQRVRSGKLDFEDMLTQLQTVRRMGSLKSVLKLLPGAHSLPTEMMDGLGEAGIGRIEAMILSMTPFERRNPDILNGSRKRRIAAGSGTTVQDLNRLLKQMEAMRKQMKVFTRLARSRKQGRPPGAWPR